jgi:hypothetical protein
MNIPGMETAAVAGPVGRVRPPAADGIRNTKE